MTFDIVPYAVSRSWRDGMSAMPLSHISSIDKVAAMPAAPGAAADDGDPRPALWITFTLISLYISTYLSILV
jgi:hypothetical protein